MNNGRHYRTIEPLITNKCKYAESKNRSKEVLISRLRLGKCRLNFYLHQIKNHSTGYCDMCKVPETIDILHYSENQIFRKLQMTCDNLRLKCNLQNALSISDLTQIIF